VTRGPLRVLALAGVAALACAQGADVPEADREEWRMDARRLSEQLEAEGIRDARVLRAIRDVPRHRFVPAGQRAAAWEDRALPIGEEQTISQPYVVAFMTQAAAVRPTDNVLEVGTGSGYQAAVLAQVLGLAPGADAAAPHGRLASIEIVPALALRAARTLEELGYRDVALRTGDGYRGWPERAPFDAIVVTAAPDHVPEPLKEQLAPGGRLVIPVGDRWQELLVVTRTETGFEERSVLSVIFVPMTGEAQHEDR